MRDENYEILDSKITIHDQHRFEVKLDIDLPDCARNSYRIEVFFFVPRALNITGNTFFKTDFYSSIQRYIRFKTPQIGLAKIHDPSVEASPLNRIRILLGRIAAGDQDVQLAHRISDEIKLLGTIIRGSIRDHVRNFLDRAGQFETDPGLRASMLRFIDELEALLDELRKLEIEIRNPVVPPRLHAAYRFFDEFLSLSIEDYFSLLLKEIRSPAHSRLDPEIDRLVCGILKDQQRHRVEMGYPSVIRKGQDNSVVPYRKGVLKKFISSILHLQLEKTEWEAVSQFNFAIAAGVAMLFAAVVTVFAQNRFSTNSSIFIMIVVVSYILKDRMKDWLKIILSRRMVRWAADHKTRIMDPHSGEVIGGIKEAFSFMEYANVPAEVRTRRNRDNLTSIDEEGKPEAVMKYEKEVLLYPRKISRFHERRRDINDIMRFDVSQWLRQADDPKVEYVHYSTEENSIEVIPCAKVYHVNVIFKYRTSSVDGEHQFEYERIRLVLDRNGIVSLVPVKT